MDLLFEDVGDIDLTTYGLAIGHRRGVLRFAPKASMVLSGVSEVKKMLQGLDATYTFYKNDGDVLERGELILEVNAEAKTLHTLWKISQNIFEYMSGIATYTHEMTQKAKAINPHFVVATTRKNFPGAKKLMLQAVHDGGGVAHRLGLYDSILIFKQHLAFIDSEGELEEKFTALKRKFVEKKITVEVESFEEALKFASLGADILQCEKMTFEQLQHCVGLKKEYPQLLLSSTGGITLANIEDHAKSGVDFVVTSSPYHAKPCDVKVEMCIDTKAAL